MPATFNERLLRKKDMLLPFLLIGFHFLDFVSSYTTTVELCYGSDYDVPMYYVPPIFTNSIYFKQRGKQKTLAVNDGKSVHKRFSVGIGSIKLNRLTEQDDRAVIYFGQKDNVKLQIEDCQDAEESYYGELFSWRIPSSTAYIEFSRVMSSGNTLEPVVIWNRTDPSVGNVGTLKRGYYELQNLKPKDSGYYKCMAPKGYIMEWKKLEVKGYERNVEAIVGEDLKIDFPVKFSAISQILFTHRDGGYEREIDIEYMEPRMHLTERYFSINDVKHEDAGNFKFIDDEGFLALRLEIDLDDLSIFDYPLWVYFVGVIVVLFLVCCCCCVKRCCCKKRSNKRSSTETNAPQVFYHDSNQPTQPVVPLLSREPRVSHADPPTYNSSVGNMDHPPPSQITVPGGLERTATPVFPPSTDSDPRFEFKGAVFPSAPPLSSGTDIQHVYNSEKLNFL